MDSNKFDEIEQFKRRPLLYELYEMEKKKY